MGRETLRKFVKYVTVWIRKCGPMQMKTFSQTSLREWSRRYCLFGFAWISLSKNGKYNLRLPAAILPKIQLLFVSLPICYLVKRRQERGGGGHSDLREANWIWNPLRTTLIKWGKVSEWVREWLCKPVSVRASAWVSARASEGASESSRTGASHFSKKRLDRAFIASFFRPH